MKSSDQANQQSITREDVLHALKKLIDKTSNQGQLNAYRNARNHLQESEDEIMSFECLEDLNYFSDKIIGDLRKHFASGEHD
jgi:hypothetical protein